MRYFVSFLYNSNVAPRTAPVKLSPPIGQSAWQPMPKSQQSWVQSPSFDTVENDLNEGRQMK